MRSGSVQHYQFQVPRSLCLRIQSVEAGYRKDQYVWHFSYFAQAIRYLPLANPYQHSCKTSPKTPSANTYHLVPAHSGGDDVGGRHLREWKRYVFVQKVEEEESENSRKFLC